jgi:hypothetical protein
MAMLVRLLMIESSGERLTSSAVQVCEVENISRTAHGVAGAAETNLTLLELLKGGSDGRDGESEDVGELHVDGLGFLVEGWKRGVWLLVVGGSGCELM